MTTVNNNVGLDNSWTAELVRSIDKRTTEGGFGNYVMGMGESALVVVASLVDAVKHAVFMAPYSLLTLDIGASFWHGTRAVTHVLEAPLALPGVLVPQITVATAKMLQITSRWEAQPAPANWKEKTITFAKEGLEKVRNIPHAVLGLKIAGGAAAVGGAGYGAHSFGLLNPVYNLLGIGGVPPKTEPGLISWALSYVPYGIGTAAENLVTPYFNQAQDISTGYTGMGLGTMSAIGFGAAALYNVADKIRHPSLIINEFKVQDEHDENVFHYKTPLECGYAFAARLWDHKTAVTGMAIAVGAQVMGIHNNTALTAGVTAYAASRIARTEG